MMATGWGGGKLETNFVGIQVWLWLPSKTVILWEGWGGLGWCVGGEDVKHDSCMIV